MKTIYQCEKKYKTLYTKLKNKHEARHIGQKWFYLDMWKNINEGFWS